MRVIKRTHLQRLVSPSSNRPRRFQLCLLDREFFLEFADCMSDFTIVYISTCKKRGVPMFWSSERRLTLTLLGLSSAESA